MPTKAFERLNPEKKQRIIDASFAEFMHHTVDNASVNSIAKRAGVSRTTLYYYFADISDIFKAIIDKLMEEFKGQMFVDENEQIDVFESFYNLFAYVSSFKGTEGEDFVRRLFKDMTTEIRRIITEPYIEYYTKHKDKVKGLHKIKYESPRELYDILFMLFSIVTSSVIYYYTTDVPYERVEERVKNGFKVVRFGAIKEEYRKEELKNE